LLAQNVMEFFSKIEHKFASFKNLFRKLLITPFMQSLQWSITGHERRVAAVSAATGTALIEKYSQEQIPDR